MIWNLFPGLIVFVHDGAFVRCEVYIQQHSQMSYPVSMLFSVGCCSHDRFVPRYNYANKHSHVPLFSYFLDLSLAA